ncbi:MAG: hypothetical protein M0Q53_11865 [Prolixibacteraceae bacterium]|jgi:hypothetical protein|nr:hypothetical protein [Prolixibacteraceae bacterium]
MKKITMIYSLALLVLISATGCTLKDGIDQDVSFLKTAVSANVNKIFDIKNDNSGKVTITLAGEGVTSFLVGFGHGTGSGATATVLPGGNTTHVYPEGSYTVSIATNDIAGNKTSTTYPLVVTYRAPENIAVTLNQSVHNLKVKAKADYAASFMVYFGDVANEAGTALATGAEISHDYATSGNYNVRVVALSGGAAKSEKTTAIVVTDPFGLPITFDNAFVSYFFGTFGDGQQFATVANPSATGLNTSAKVGKLTRGAQGWSGTYSPLNVPIDFATGKKIKVLVYNPDPALVGKKLNVELEWAVGGVPSNGVAVLKMPLTTSGAWEELVFDYSGIAGIPAGTKFTQLVLRFNDSANGAGAVIYVDNFRLTN